MSGWCWRRGVNAWVVLLAGVGFLVLLVGMFTDFYSVGIGFIGLAASWILALTTAVYFARPCDTDRDEF